MSEAKSAAKEAKPEKTLSVAIKSMDNGETVTYVCSDYFLAPEDYHYLGLDDKGEQIQCIRRGEVVELPESVARKYLEGDTRKRKLEIV
ncbi:hypothetical protein [Porticoccus sp.]